MTSLKNSSNELDEIINSFSFLIDEYGFNIIDLKQQNNYKGKYLVIYLNNNSKIQLEICADSNFFDCTIRRIVDNEPSKYSDEDNCIGFNSLAILESDNQYDDYDYYVGGRLGLAGVLSNTVKLFKRHKTFFTSDIWLDVGRVKDLLNEAFLKKHYFRPSENKDTPTFFSMLKKEVSLLLTKKGFSLTLDSEELPFYDNDGMTKKIIYKNEKWTIKLSARDWRDLYFLYYLEINGKIIFEINLTEVHNENLAVEIVLNKLINWMKKNGY